MLACSLQPFELEQRLVVVHRICSAAEKLLREKNLPGLSVGVVRLDDGNVITEFGAWGKMSEDDEATDPKVTCMIVDCY